MKEEKMENSKESQGSGGLELKKAQMEFEKACEQGDMDGVKRGLRNHPGVMINTPPLMEGLYKAIRGGHLKVVKYLLTDPEVKDRGQKEVLQEDRGGLLWVLVAQMGNKEVIEYLLTSKELKKAGHETHWMWHYKEDMVLRWSCLMGRSDLVKWLLGAMEARGGAWEINQGEIWKAALGRWTHKNLVDALNEAEEKQRLKRNEKGKIIRPWNKKEMLTQLSISLIMNKDIRELEDWISKDVWVGEWKITKKEKKEWMEAWTQKITYLDKSVYFLKEINHSKVLQDHGFKWTEEQKWKSLEKALNNNVGWDALKVYLKWENNVQDHQETDIKENQGGLNDLEELEGFNLICSKDRAIKIMDIISDQILVENNQKAIRNLHDFKVKPFDEIGLKDWGGKIMKDVTTKLFRSVDGAMNENIKGFLKWLIFEAVEPKDDVWDHWKSCIRFKESPVAKTIMEWMNAAHEKHQMQSLMNQEVDQEIKATKERGDEDSWLINEKPVKKVKKL